jgi:geranylgeranyl diphosphate synthase, type II
MESQLLLSDLEKTIDALSWGHEPRSLYAPIQYMMSLGGKRLRPLLTCLSYSLYKKDVEQIVPYAVAVEAFHNFTLMHDDIMDKAPLRRGKKTVHEKWNVNTAILSGDVMLVKVYDLFLGLPNDQLKEVLRIFNRTAAEVCEGQQWDMEFETKAKVSHEQYLDMIRLKTAVLLGFSLELGALVGGAGSSDRQALYNFGVNIGVGFQLKDDLLDVYGDQKKFGKQVGGDIIANKKTFLLIKAQELARGKDKAELMKWLSAKKFSKPAKVKAVTKLYDRLGVKELTEQQIGMYFEKAFQSLNSLSASEKISTLISFARDIAARQK